MRRWSFSKGHGTENDFVVLLDRDDTMHVGPAEVRYLCDRHAGIGGDGLLRAVRARHVPEWDGDGALWFMDYRNADGSVAQMCGNGLRVFARFLLDHDLASGPTIPVATRSGLKEATVLPDTRIRVSMGPVRVEQPGTPLAVRTADGAEHAVLPADVGNPHAVAFVDDLAALDLTRAPRVPDGAFPEGVNVEFVRVLGPRHLALRVHERGVGETRSCGTGTVAAAAAARVHAGDTAPLPVTYRVEVPGGEVEVELAEDQAHLTGPAVLIAHGQVLVPEEG
ncbi:diaminopimelate epimerase [Microlunatus capsulatus]|uniref:Diaminopimelate epimerase n=1 Tax=Microlunatus capsulatus TaxID=99117 RepID=A0ABS4ZCQ8_9ACTN|nr:diaminopimelate epimerase [Microlunatus capsulatus]MBP2418854.1 diaminopimelate epimerase [Microlunatus capsulatus]